MENIFISHIHEEAPLAIALKHWLEKTTAGQWKVFVSSDKDNITLGEDWFGKIEGAQATQKTFIVLCSPTSKLRPWINYETGYAAAKGVPILPLRHSGLEEKDLPPFLSRYQNTDIEAEGFVKSLFDALQKHLPLLGPPHIPEQEISKAINELLTQFKCSSEFAPLLQTTPTAADIESEECKHILKIMYNHHENHVRLIALSDIARLLPARVREDISVLAKAELVDVKVSTKNNHVYLLTDKGKEYIISHGISK